MRAQFTSTCTTRLCHAAVNRYALPSQQKEAKAERSAELNHTRDPGLVTRCKGFCRHSRLVNGFLELSSSLRHRLRASYLSRMLSGARSRCRSVEPFLRPFHIRQLAKPRILRIDTHLMLHQIALRSDKESLNGVFAQHARGAQSRTSVWSHPARPARAQFADRPAWATRHYCRSRVLDRLSSLIAKKTCLFRLECHKVVYNRNKPPRLMGHSKCSRKTPDNVKKGPRQSGVQLCLKHTTLERV
ncbi:hypothetical protein BCR37DRAFT_382994 [Protomyces lactucae-debilis]|uniref:Uncharacterized protein n=1 Tax=Protomyces lactucae-debilis TaxID=2754530 RepID=A0A1Y2EZE6_PROLT|nr:uncharacterized protein BCR37DRAFT_382994 [Protomyces lactucae-debilis]ORY77002.1 hypothetical protein BCR37DRAFT_382994 [Protomyces lactucae-debilis]